VNAEANGCIPAGGDLPVPPTRFTGGFHVAIASENGAGFCESPGVIGCRSTRGYVVLIAAVLLQLLPGRFSRWLRAKYGSWTS